jgi:hypothetical protein
LTETITKDKYLYEQGHGRESMQKSWKDKKKDKYDQRKKRFKPPFNRNEPNKNHQDHYAIRMNPRKKTPWEKGEDHQSNVGDTNKITCTRISHIERTK